MTEELGKMELQVADNVAYVLADGQHRTKGKCKVIVEACSKVTYYSNKERINTILNKIPIDAYSNPLSLLSVFDIFATMPVDADSNDFDCEPILKDDVINIMSKIVACKPILLFEDGSSTPCTWERDNTKPRLADELTVVSYKMLFVQLLVFTAAGLRASYPEMTQTPPSFKSTAMDTSLVLCRGSVLKTAFAMP